VEPLVPAPTEQAVAEDTVAEPQPESEPEPEPEPQPEPRWGVLPPPARIAALEQRLRAWEQDREADHTTLRSPFDAAVSSSPLTGADVFYLAARTSLGSAAGKAPDEARIAAAAEDLCRLQRKTIGGSGGAQQITKQITKAIPVSCLDLHLEGADLRAARLEEANLFGAHLEHARLDAARLDGAILTGAHLFRAHLDSASLRDAHLEDVDLRGADLNAALLDGARLERARLSGAHLEHARLRGACLARARLRGAALRGAVLRDASLERADLKGVYLEGADLRHARLEGANLSAASFDKASRLSGVGIAGASFDQVTFEAAALTGVDWSRLHILGDERRARQRTDQSGKRKERVQRVAEHQAAVRANRVLAVALQARGLDEDAARFAYRAQVLQRRIARLQRRPGAYLFSALLALLAGYGHRPGRTLCWYVVTVLGFALAYALLGPAYGHPFQADSALVFSLTAFHGRGFFPPSLMGEDPVTILAVLEALMGLVLEITAIGLITQRFSAVR
jgi:uncharacterized protein YjbI with pentapeptide repeats